MQNRKFYDVDKFKVRGPMDTFVKVWAQNWHKLGQKL